MFGVFAPLRARASRKGVAVARMVKRSRKLPARLHWALLPYAHPRPTAEDRADGCIWHWWWLGAYWAMKLVERLPASYLFEPIPPVDCGCDYCRGLTDEWTP